MNLGFGHSGFGCDGCLGKAPLIVSLKLGQPSRFFELPDFDSKTSGMQRRRNLPVRFSRSKAQLPGASVP